MAENKELTKVPVLFDLRTKHGFFFTYGTKKYFFFNPYLERSIFNSKVFVKDTGRNTLEVIIAHMSGLEESILTIYNPGVVGNGEKGEYVKMNSNSVKDQAGGGNIIGVSSQSGWSIYIEGIRQGNGKFLRNKFIEDEFNGRGIDLDVVLTNYYLKMINSSKNEDLLVFIDNLNEENELTKKVEEATTQFKTVPLKEALASREGPVSNEIISPIEKAKGVFNKFLDFFNK